MQILKYERLNDTHANSLLTIWADEEVIRYTNIKVPCTLVEIKERINILKDFEVFMVSDEEGFCGVIGCPCMDQATAQYGIFYQFQKSRWGKGYATRTVEWLIEYMRNKYKGCTLLADVVENNMASEKILKKSGFKYVSEENGFERNGIRMKIHHYKLEFV